jgi:GTPase
METHSSPPLLCHNDCCCTTIQQSQINIKWHARCDKSTRNKNTSNNNKSRMKSAFRSLELSSPRWILIGSRLSSFAADAPIMYNTTTSHRRLLFPSFGAAGQQLQRQQSRRTLEYLVDPQKIAQENARGNKSRSRPKVRGKSMRQTHLFVDRCRLRVSGGRGGRGCTSMQVLTRKRHIRPDGGNGGDGGSVLIIADPVEQTLSRSNPHVVAEDGGPGRSQQCHGARGKNKIIRVPLGVVVRRVLDPDEEWDAAAQQVRKVHGAAVEEREEIRPEDFPKEPEFIPFGGFTAKVSIDYNEDDEEAELVERQVVPLADLDEPGSYLLVARGGRGGEGTFVYASKPGQPPDIQYLNIRAQPEAGEVVHLELELKLIADIGLVGFPNAGKSSLLRAMSAASPEVAAYPFTTLNPLMGCIEYRDGFRVQAADIPGLIDGAAEGRGKGHDFLRHIERTKALLYIVDSAGVDGRDPISDLKILAKELGSYGDGSLIKRRALVVANKVDLLSKDQEEELLIQITETAAELGIQFEHDVMAISAGVTGEGLGVLSRAIREIVIKSEEDRIREFERQQSAQNSMKRLQEARWVFSSDANRWEPVYDEENVEEA